MSNRTFNSKKPAACAKCNSELMIPIVDGALDAARSKLSAQKRIAIRGSIAIEEGEAIWACAECGNWVTDPEYVLKRENLALVRTYERAVQAAFDDFEPINEAEYRRLNGKSLLTSLIQQNFASDVQSLVLEISENDLFVVGVHRCGVSPITKSNSQFTIDRLRQIHEF